MNAPTNFTLGDLKRELESAERLRKAQHQLDADAAALGLGGPGAAKHKFSLETSLRRIAHDVREGAEPGIETGFVDLDALLGGGYRPGEFHIIAARTAQGKSAFMLTQAMSMAGRGVKTAYVSLEMTAVSLVQRMVVQKAQISLNRLRWDRSRVWGRPDDIEVKAIGDAMRELLKLPIEIIDRGAGFATIVENIEALAASGAKVVIIDGLWLMRGDTNQDLRIELKRMTGRLKELSIIHNITICGVHQINRSVEGRQDTRPCVADLRDSSIEDDADSVCGLWRPVMYLKESCPEDQRDAAECIVLKNRNGPTGTVHLKFHGEFMQFANLTTNKAA